MRRLVLAAARGLLMQRYRGEALSVEPMMASLRAFSAVVVDAGTSSPSSSSSSSAQQHSRWQHQQRRSNFTGAPPRWYKSAGVEKDGEVR